MDLSLNDTQQLIQDSARDFVRGACNRDVLLKLDRNPSTMMDGIWRQMSELGWTGLGVPEEYGGTGNALTDVAVLFEELGTGPVPGPLFSSSVLNLASGFGCCGLMIGASIVSMAVESMSCAFRSRLLR